MDYTRPIQIADSGHVTLTAWPLSTIAANASDFMLLLESVTASLQGRPAALPPTDSVALMERVIRLSLAHPEDVARIRACDLPDLLEGIWEINGLVDLVKKSLALRLKATQAQAELLPREA